jgi:hypothetical protein
MCGATSGAQDRVIEKDTEETTMTSQTAQTMYATAEVDYRLHRATALYPHGQRRLRVRRRRTLHLPHPRPRPLSLA